MSLFGRQKNEPDWESLFADQARRNPHLFFRVAHRVLRDRSAAEEAVQDALAKAWERRRDLKDPTHLGAWIVQIVIRESLQLTRRTKIGQRVLQKHGAAGNSVFKRPEIGDVRQDLLRAVQKLPEPSRVIVALRLVEEMSGKEVARHLGCSQGEVSRQFHSGMKLIREILADWRLGEGEAERESNVL